MQLKQLPRVVRGSHDQIRDSHPLEPTQDILNPFVC
jgi:hypothetical protein